ncbi:Aldo/keto reductase [Trametes elegans]|nr:Aldo/keto reductase [Trametes elegans]
MTQLTLALNDGHRIRWLGFGTGTTLLRKDASALVRNAVEHGIAHLDGAEGYANEASLGAGLAAAGAPRAELFVTTKVLSLPEGRTARAALADSLRALGPEYVDLYLLHSPQRLAGRVREAWEELEQLEREGLVRSIGVSNFRIQDLEDLLQVAVVVPAVNQNEYHPYVRKTTEPLLEYLKKHNILATSYGGLTPLVYHKGGPVDRVLTSISERLSKETAKEVTEGQVLGLWLRAQGIPQITTSTKPERVKEYLATESLPDLLPAEIAAINEGDKFHSRICVGPCLSTTTTSNLSAECKWIDD